MADSHFTDTLRLAAFVVVLNGFGPLACWTITQWLRSNELVSAWVKKPISFTGFAKSFFLTLLAIFPMACAAGFIPSAPSVSLFLFACAFITFLLVLGVWALKYRMQSQALLKSFAANPFRNRGFVISLGASSYIILIILALFTPKSLVFLAVMAGILGFIVLAGLPVFTSAMYLSFAFPIRKHAGNALSLLKDNPSALTIGRGTIVRRRDQGWLRVRPRYTPYVWFVSEKGEKPAAVLIGNVDLPDGTKGYRLKMKAVPRQKGWREPSPTIDIFVPENDMAKFGGWSAEF